MVLSLFLFFSFSFPFSTPVCFWLFAGAKGGGIKKQIFPFLVFVIYFPVVCLHQIFLFIFSPPQRAFFREGRKGKKKRLKKGGFKKP